MDVNAEGTYDRRKVLQRGAGVALALAIPDAGIGCGDDDGGDDDDRRTPGECKAECEPRVSDG
jgi:hypothetical protein